MNFTSFRNFLNYNYISLFRLSSTTFPIPMIFFSNFRSAFPSIPWNVSFFITPINFSFCSFMMRNISRLKSRIMQIFICSIAAFHRAKRSMFYATGFNIEFFITQLAFYINSRMNFVFSSFGSTHNTEYNIFRLICQGPADLRERRHCQPGGPEGCSGYADQDYQGGVCLV